MSIQLRTINLTVNDGHPSGSITLHDGDTHLDVTVHVAPQFLEPGCIVRLDDAAVPEDGNVFVYEGDRIVRTLLLTAEEVWNRERAVRAVMASHLVEGIDQDPDMEALTWRFARGEISFDLLEENVARLTTPTTPRDSDNTQ